MKSNNKKLVWILDDEWEEHQLIYSLLNKAGVENIHLTRSAQLEKDLPVYAHKADAVLAQVSFPVTKELITSLDSAKIIAVTGGGFNCVDLKAATEKGIPVTYVPGYCVEEVSDHVISLLYVHAKRIFSFRQWARVGRWDPTRFKGIQRLCTQTLGLIGLGKIGSRVGEKAVKIGLNVIAFDPFVKPEQMEKLNIKPATLEDVLVNSDYISLHVPLTPETKNLLDSRAFSKMKSTVFLINTCRGAVIDEEALVEALINNKIAGAGLDVLVKEPPEPDSPLLNLEQVIVTPHSAYVSEQALDELMYRAVDNVLRVFDGLEPFNKVN